MTPGRRFSLGLLVAWMVYDVNGFRPPWSPIVVSDASSGSAMRQLLFTAAGGTAFLRLWLGGQLGPALMRHRALVALALGLLLSTAWSADPVLTIKRSIIFNLALLTLIAAVHEADRPLRELQLLVTGVTGAAAWISLGGWVVLPRAAVSIAERPGLAGVSGHPNTLAPALVTGFVVSLTGRPSSVTERAALRVAQLGQLVALVLTDSITSMLLLIVVLVLRQLLVSSRYRRGWGQLAGITATLAVLLIGPAVIKTAAFSAAGRDESLSGRDELWLEVAREGAKTPFFGQGFGAFWYEGRGREIVGTWNPRQAHNAWVDVFVDLGMFGLAGLVLVIGGGLWAAWRRHRGDRPGPRRSAAGTLVAWGVALLGLYALAESFLLKSDKLPMLVLLWTLVLLGNRGGNDLEHELPLPAAGADETGNRLAVPACNSGGVSAREAGDAPTPAD